MPLRIDDDWLRTAAIVAAGGRGDRFGGGRPKQLLELGGRAVLDRSVSALIEHPSIDEVIIALPADLVADPPPYLRPSAKPLRLVVGGPRRQDSVANAMAVVGDEVDLVLIHDAARPFVSADLITRCLAAAAARGAAVAAIAARDTVKQAAADRVVERTLPRERIFLAQTPQVFRRGVLRDAMALAEAAAEATDEATLAERAGHPVQLVEGELSNIKITVPDDVPIAETLAAGVRPTLSDPGWRVGTGYDLHRLVEGRPLILGGVTIPHDRGLLGHSDADAVCHAITDALLGAAALGDIGRHFPDTDPQYSGASSLELLRRAVALLDAAGCAIINVDVTVIAQRPKLAPYVDAIRQQLGDTLRLPVDRIGVKGKTNEGVDAVGRGEAIATHAVALVGRRQSPAAAVRGSVNL